MTSGPIGVTLKWSSGVVTLQSDKERSTEYARKYLGPWATSESIELPMSGGRRLRNQSSGATRQNGWLVFARAKMGRDQDRTPSK